MANLIWLVLAFPLVGVLINGLILTGTKREVQKQFSGWIASVASLAAFVVALSIFGQLSSILGGATFRDVVAYNWIEMAGGALTVPLGLRIDPLSVTMMLVVTGVGTLIHFFAMYYMADDPRYGRFFTYLNLFMFAMLILVLANNYVLMFVGWEGVGLCSYLLIGFWFEKVSAAQAGKKAFLINRVGDFGFLLAIFAMFWLTGSVTFNTVEGTGVLDQAAKLSQATVWTLPAVLVICLLLFLGATGKSAQLPLYIWLPDAMEGPTPVSALIHAATMVTAGVYMIARSAALFGQEQTVQAIIAIIGIATALWAAVLALKQYDIKRVLAWSTISQLGYMFIGVGVGAYAAGISHLVTHAFFKALMFLGAAVVMHSLDGQLDMRKMGNLKKYLPVTYGTFFVGWLAIAGMPPLAGFWSKDAILEGVWHRWHGEHNVLWLAIFALGVFTAGLTAFYMTRMFVTTFHGEERIEMGDEGHGDSGHGKGRKPVHVHPETTLSRVPLIALAVLSVVGGLVAVVLPNFIHDVTVATVPAAEIAAKPLVWNWPNPTDPNVYIPTLSGFIAGVLGLGLAWSIGADKFAKGWSRQTESLLGVHHAFYEGTLHTVFVKGGTRLSQFLYRPVDRAIDGVVNGVAWVVDYFAESLRTLQTGYVRNYALVMLAGAVFVVACFLVILQQTIK